MSSGKEKKIHIKKAVKKKAYESVLRKSRFWATVWDLVRKNGAHIVFGGEYDLFVGKKYERPLGSYVWGIEGSKLGVTFRPFKIAP